MHILYVVLECFDDRCEDDGQKNPIPCKEKCLLEEGQKDTSEICYSKTLQWGLLYDKDSLNLLLYADVISIGRLVRKSDGPEQIGLIMETMTKYGSEGK